MNENKLRDIVRELIKKQISENKEITREGVMSNILNHISGVLKKSRDKRFQGKLAAIAKSSPQGKKAVEDTLKHAKALEDSWDDVQKELQSLRNR
jgi:hypothetical protein